MIDRRGLGLIVIGLVLLAAVVVPNAVGRSIPGVAEAVPVPGPPATGDCVAQKFDLGWNMAGADPSQYRYPELTVGDCVGTHYGEVVSVIAAPTKVKFDVDPSGSNMSIDDGNLSACYVAASRFIGAPADQRHPVILFNHWWLSTYPQVVLLTPTSRQRAAGQHWLACAVYLTDQSDSVGITLASYTGSLRNAESTGVGRDHLGTCPREADWNQMIGRQLPRAASRRDLGWRRVGETGHPGRAGIKLREAGRADHEED